MMKQCNTAKLVFTYDDDEYIPLQCQCLRLSRKLSDAADVVPETVGLSEEDRESTSALQELQEMMNGA